MTILSLVPNIGTQMTKGINNYYSKWIRQTNNNNNSHHPLKTLNNLLSINKFYTTKQSLHITTIQSYHTHFTV